MPKKKPIKINKTVCIFCSEVDQHPLLGPVIEKNGLKMHTNCIFAASGLSQANTEGETSDNLIVGFPIPAILNELKRGRNLKCSVCRLHGACVGCVVNACHTTFHLPCLIKAQGVTIFEGNFPSYCRRHANRQNLDNWLMQCKEPPSCCICLFSIIPDKEFESSCLPIKKQKSVSNSSVSIKKNVPVINEIRRTRRSCVTPSTPKRITVSNGMSSVKRRYSQSDLYRMLSLYFSTSTWELPGSSSEPEEQNPIQQQHRKSHEKCVTLPPSMSHIPGWLTDYFLNLAPEKRLPVFEAWKHHTIHGLCCPLAWMHRNCIAGFAVSAALHYLKCPYCANRDIFIRSIIDVGIWVPDQDAAWELEPGAYADLVPISECSSNLNDDSDSDITSSSSSQCDCNGWSPKVIADHATQVLQIRDVRNGYGSSSGSPSTDQEHVSVLSLKWNNQSLKKRRGRKTSTRRQKQVSQAITSTPGPIRVSRRHTSMTTRNIQDDHSPNSALNETRLRQVTLGSFLSVRTQTSR
ncbi:G2/M phase-specific E3 ubiquitin-protein ligase isoform 2 [Schistosoma japonicum]|uniref:G2/M phase-specific E3 ubiquitin-protein ligase isoform 2 n=2 Tax=Schistosoma japonicum TaxID=6182 RepID=A0A4Z2DW20_SCHJA|nr:PHD finger protein 7 [Schistosoma japonicum]TNN20649.1 G2/M phase-specific E3 ubiquitin-protein ligase isoform 2 [Schistosoma japonicum]